MGCNDNKVRRIRFYIFRKYCSNIPQTDGEWTASDHYM